MIASVLMAASARATETMTNGVFTGTSPQRVFCAVSDLQNEPGLNAVLAEAIDALKDRKAKINQYFKAAYGAGISRGHKLKVVALNSAP